MNPYRDMTAAELVQLNSVVATELTLRVMESASESESGKWEERNTRQTFHIDDKLNALVTTLAAEHGVTRSRMVNDMIKIAAMTMGHVAPETVSEA